jgi:hypothetical protein
MNLNVYDYNDLKHIPYRFKYKYHKFNKSLAHFTFDFKYRCTNLKKLRQSKVFKTIVKYNLQNFFKLICKHYYFYKFGPKLNHICTRQIKLFKQEYSKRKPKKCCCNKIILITKEEWSLPLFKKWNYKRYIFFLQTFLFKYVVTFFLYYIDKFNQWIPVQNFKPK